MMFDEFNSFYLKVPTILRPVNSAEKRGI
jgi:hypothetical protein